MLAFNPSPAFVNSNGVADTATGAGATDASGIGLWCYSDGEASLPVRKELQSGKTLTSALGYSLNYNTLDNNKNPTDGLLIDFKQDFAGVGGDVTYIKTAIDVKYYTPLVSDIVGLIHVQGGILNKLATTELRMLDHFQMGPNLVRGFAPNGIGPRDINPFGTRTRSAAPNIGARRRNCRCRSGSCRRKSGSEGLGLCRRRRSLGLPGTDRVGADRRNQRRPAVSSPRQQSAQPGTCLGLMYDDGNVVRTSVGVGLIWASPFGPLRFDYAVPITKGKFDRVQQFRFGGGTSF